MLMMDEDPAFFNYQETRPGYDDFEDADASDEEDEEEEEEEEEF